MDQLPRWILPAAMSVTVPLPCYAVQYLTVPAAQKLCFPDCDRFTPTHVKFTLHAKNSAYGISAQDLPPRVRVTFDYTEPTPALCSESTFYLGYCVASSKLACR